MNASHRLKQGQSLLLENLNLNLNLSTSLTKTKSEMPGQHDNMEAFKGKGNSFIQTDSDQMGAIRPFDEEGAAYQR